MAYCTLDDLRAEGVSEAELSNQDYLTDRIQIAQAYIDLMTGRFFEVRSGITIKVDGRGHDTIFLMIPPVTEDAISEVSLNDEVVDSDYYTVYKPTTPDGRFNPQIIKSSGVWTKGNKNVSITGDFGFVDVAAGPVYTAPPLIKDLCVRLVMWNLQPLGDHDSDKNNRIVEESLGDYRYKLADMEYPGAFGDSRIDNIIAMYKYKRILGV